MKTLILIVSFLGSVTVSASDSACERKAKRVAEAIERTANDNITDQDEIRVRASGSATEYEVELKFSDGSASYYRVTLKGHSKACWGVSEVVALIPPEQPATPKKQHYEPSNKNVCFGSCGPGGAVP